MILPNPPIGFSFVAVPVWRLENVPGDDPPPDSAAAPSAGGWDCEPVDAAPPPPPPSTTRWVFKGYEWRPFATWYPFVNPGWDHLVDNDPRDIHERAIRQEQERQANEAAALAKAERSRPAPPSPGGGAVDAASPLSSGNGPSSEAPHWPAAGSDAKLDPKRTSP